MPSEQAPSLTLGMPQHYGIHEIAESLGIDRQLVTVWRFRLSHGMPPPDEELKAGRLWVAGTIEPWIISTRLRLELENSPGERSALLPTRALRRYFRLTTVLLEEKLRPKHAGQPASALGELVPALEAEVLSSWAGSPMPTVSVPDTGSRKATVPQREDHDPAIDRRTLRGPMSPSPPGCWA